MNNRISFADYHGHLQVVFQESKNRSYGIGFINKFETCVTLALNPNPPALSLQELQSITAKMKTL